VAIYLDSADLSDARSAAALGFCEGFTTNPALLARHAVAPLTRFAELLEIFGSGTGFYQPSSADPAAAEPEARAAVALAPRRVVVKLPARTDQFALARRLSAEGVTCAMTAVYAPAQALVARAAGAAWVIPYADRARRLDPAGEGLVVSLSAVVAPMGGGLRILAASLKDPDQVARAAADGAHDVTVPFGVLARLADHPLSDRAIREFEEAAGAAQVPTSPAG
jgi:transaldolase